MKDGEASSVTRAADTLKRFRRLQRLARLLDSEFQLPGTRWRFGLDPLIGLVPGLGDAASAIVSLWLIAEAGRLGAPSASLLKMLLNVLVDSAAGSIPILGDAFDAGYKANLRNVALLERALFEPGRKGSTK
ncbi:MAG: DUF4112 domain-containing protein [Nitrococcus mobilis]|nr:DUF4112 domain-containing protein [Nitrococcus mobilis]